jgi:hypothetical protein
MNPALRSRSQARSRHEPKLPLQVVEVVDDRPPSLVWGGVQHRETVEVWDEVFEGERVELERDAQAATVLLG